MLRLGQNTKSRLLRGIFVSILRAAVAFISSVTVRRTSRFSRGKRAMRALSVSISVDEGARSDDEVGRVKVESDGGLRSAGIGLGPEGIPGPPMDFDIIPLALEGGA
jgi:hypothetical protein